MGWNNATETADISGSSFFQTAYVNIDTGRIASFTNSSLGIKVDKYVSADKTKIIYKSAKVSKLLLWNPTANKYSLANGSSTNFSSPATPTGASFTRVAGKPYYSSGYWYTSSTTGSIYRSSNTTSWTLVATTSNAVSQFASDENGNMMAVMFGQGIILKSTDGGATWSNSSLLPANAAPGNAYFTGVVYYESKFVILSYNYSSTYISSIANVSSTSYLTNFSVTGAAPNSMCYSATVDATLGRLYLQLWASSFYSAWLCYYATIPTSSFSPTSVRSNGSMFNSPSYFDRVEAINGNVLFPYRGYTNMVITSGTQPAAATAIQTSWVYENKFYIKGMISSTPTIWESTDCTSWTDVTASFVTVPASTDVWYVGVTR